jgi:ribosomal-protein-alanine N-acetyltransferase
MNRHERMTPPADKAAATARVRIHLAGPQEAETLAEVHRAAFGEKGWSAADIEKMLAVEGTEALLARCDGTNACGMIITRMMWEDGEILTLGVRPEFRRLGIGGRLFASAVNGMVMQGVNRVFLEVAETNTAAIRLYEAAGFEVMGRRPNYYLEEDGARVDALMMVRVFGQGCGG